jgi:hypothetical protein
VFCRIFCLAGVVVVAGSAWAVGSSGNQPAPARSFEMKPGAAARTFAIEMRAKPWFGIFEWLTDQTGMPFVSKIPPPPGTFNFIAKAGQRFTLGELIDLLNDGLAAHRFVLLRSPTCFRLVPADEPIDKSLVAPIPLGELPERGHSEFVEIVLPLSSLNAEQYAYEVKKMMGPFGEVVVLRMANRLLMHDRAGSLRRIVALTKEIEDVQLRTITVEGYSAISVAELLRRLVPEMSGNPVHIKSLGK